jgi:hypothetical protein
VGRAGFKHCASLFDTTSFLGISLNCIYPCNVYTKPTSAPDLTVRSQSKPTLSSFPRKEIKSAHSWTLSKVARHFSTAWVYFLNLGSAAISGLGARRELKTMLTCVSCISYSFFVKSMAYCPPTRCDSFPLGGVKSKLRFCARTVQNVTNITRRYS